MRNYTRKTNRAYWNEADMKQVVEAVKSKTATIRKAAIEFHIPFETLRRRCKIVIPPQHPDLCKKKLGRFSPVLSADQENELVQYIHQMEISCYGPTRGAGRGRGRGQLPPLPFNIRKTRGHRGQIVPFEICLTEIFLDLLYI